MKYRDLTTGNNLDIRAQADCLREAATPQWKHRSRKPKGKKPPTKGNTSPHPARGKMVGEEDQSIRAFAIKLPNGKWAKSSKTNTPIWFSSKERADEVNMASYGGDGMVVPVKLKRDSYAYNGSTIDEREQRGKMVGEELIKDTPWVAYGEYANKKGPMGSFDVQAFDTPEKAKSWAQAMKNSGAFSRVKVYKRKNRVEENDLDEASIVTQKGQRLYDQVKAFFDHFIRSEPSVEELAQLLKIMGRRLDVDGRRAVISHLNEMGVDPKTVFEDDDPCWKGYRQLGMKKKKGKSVPNCVPRGDKK
jgi:hypothetical protein